jgi:channel protein (hemolysin III family)
VGRRAALALHRAVRRARLGGGRFHAAAALVLVCVGGLLYSAGGLVYGLRRPDPSPRWFGFHEVFHAFTVAAYVAQYVAVSFVVYRV